MRSKSEQRIGDLLEELRIAYRYEPELTINNRTYHPDSVIMLPSGRLVILEHVGRMDLRQYNEDLVTRLQAYDSIGLMIGRSVFFTFEHDTKDEVLLKEIVFQIITANPPWNRILQSIAAKAGCKNSGPAENEVR